MKAILNVSLSGGWYNNTLKPQKYDRVWKLAEDAMYEAKHFFKGPMMDKHRMKVGAICFPYDILRSNLEVARPGLHKSIIEKIMKDLRVADERDRRSSP